MRTFTVRSSLIAILASLPAVTSSSVAAIVTYEYAATIETVSGTPFGYTSAQARTQPVTGSFTYNTATADVNATAQRGNYPHSVGGGFAASFLSTVVTGSVTPYVTIENLTSDTFRFNDGATGSPSGGTMSVNGVSDVNVRVGMAFTDTSGTAFGSDALPANLAFANPPLANPVNFPHTFAISDSGGTLLLQMNTLTIVPEPSAAVLTAFGLAALCAWRQRRRASAS